jgi:hypothetical protein
MSTKVRVSIISSPSVREEIWTLATMKIKPGDTVSWENANRTMILFFPYCDLFAELAGAPEERIVEINKKQSGLKLKVKAGLVKAGKTRTIPYAIFHPPEAKGDDGTPRGKMIIKRSPRRSSKLAKRVKRGKHG